MNQEGRACGANAAELRRGLVRQAQRNGPCSGPGSELCAAPGGFLLTCAAAHEVFADWSYLQILEWAAENRLTVVFLPGGTLRFTGFC